MQTRPTIATFFAFAGVVFFLWGLFALGEQLASLTWSLRGDDTLITWRVGLPVLLGGSLSKMLLGGVLFFFSGKLAELVQRNPDETLARDAFSLDGLLRILLVALGFFFIGTSLPDLLLCLYNHFSTAVDLTENQSLAADLLAMAPDLAYVLAQILLGLAILRWNRGLASWAHRFSC